MRLGLRAKLLLAASALGLVPIAGYHTAQGMRDLLGAGQEAATASTASSIARVLASDLAARPTRVRHHGATPSMYVLPVRDAPQVDAYIHDWAELAPRLPLARDQVAAVSHGERVFLLVSLRVRNPAANSWLLLHSQNSSAFTSTWRIALGGRGAAVVEEIAPLGALDGPGHRDPRFVAATGRLGSGVVIEVSMPRELLASQLAIALVAPVSHDPWSATQVPGTLIALPSTGFYATLFPDSKLQQRIHGLARPGQRIWILDHTGHVLARDGAPGTPGQSGLLERATALLLPAADDSRLTLFPASGRIEAPEVAQALAGDAALRWRRATEGDHRVVSSAVPVRLPLDRSVAAVVVVEDTVTALQGLHTRAVLELIIATSAAFVLAAVILLGVGARMIGRLRDLRDDAARAIDPDGRIHGAFSSTRAHDEIGDLSRSFGSALDRIKGYNHYLEQLARRLSHELRTPVTIVRSSLENLELTTSLDGSARTYLARARDGVKRLDDLISRMTEATRLEHAVTAEDHEVIGLGTLLTASVAANADAFADSPLSLEISDSSLQVCVAPQLIVQALDKLLANARDFRAAATPVTVHVRARSSEVEIAVCNFGPIVASDPPEAIFDSMFSQRDGVSDDGQVHLGLGLYVVRLIAQAHGGRAFVRNNRDGDGVCIGFTLPLHTTPPV